MLSGRCTASDPSAFLVYYVNGTAAATMTCPPVGAFVNVTVKPVLPSLPGCPYDATKAFDTTSAPCMQMDDARAWRSLGIPCLGRRRLTTCFLHPTLLTPPPSPSLHSPYPGPAANGTFVCPSAPVITCPYPPACSAPGAVVSLAGSCGSTPTATLVYLVNGQPSATATCPPAGAPLVVAVQAVVPGTPAASCPYNATFAYNLTSEAPRALPLVSTNGPDRDRPCPSLLTCRRQLELHCVLSPVRLPSTDWRPGRSPRPTAAPTGCPPMPSITCGRPPNCTVPGATVLLVGTCSSSDAGAQLLYIVNGQISNTATCPTAGTSVVVEVKPVFPQRPECPYNASTAYTLTSARGSWVPGLGPRVSCRAHVMCLHAPMTGQVQAASTAVPSRLCAPSCSPGPTPSSTTGHFDLRCPAQHHVWERADLHHAWGKRAAVGHVCCQRLRCWCHVHCEQPPGDTCHLPGSWSRAASSGCAGVSQPSRVLLQRFAWLQPEQ